MTNLSYSNRSFQRTVKQVRKIMPVLAVILLVGVYLISAITEGVFLSTLMSNVVGGAWLSFAIAGAIQATRALLVFFPQLNPNRPTFGYQGETIAIVMGLIAIGSILGLVNAVGLPTPVAVSLSILMLAGIGVEVFFLREIRFATELELFADKDHWGELQDYHQAREEFRMFLDSLKDFDVKLISNPTQETSSTPPEKQQQLPASKANESGKRTGTVSSVVLEAIAAYELKSEDLTKVLAMVEANTEDYVVLTAIQKLAEGSALREEKRQLQEKNVTFPLDLARSGNAQA